MSTVTAPPFQSFRGASVTASLILLPDVYGFTASMRSLAERLAERGYAVTAVDTPPQTVEDVEGALDAADDGYGLQLVADACAAARVGLPDAPVFVIGVGLGATRAMMSLAATCGLSGAIGFYGRLVYPTLTERKPAQPLDLLPGVRAPLQLHFGAQDPIVPPHQIDDLRDRLERIGVTHQALAYPGATRGFLEQAAPGWDEGVARMAITRAERFLERIRAQ